MEVKSSRELQSCQRKTGPGKILSTPPALTPSFAVKWDLCYIRASMVGFNFFLYGVYDEGGACFGRFKNFIQQSRPAMVKGSLYQLQSGFSLILNQGERLVRGTLVQLDIPETQWVLFDALNGCGLEKMSAKSFVVKERVRLNSEEFSDLCVDAYCLNPEKVLMTSGEIQPELLNESAGVPTLVAGLTDRQRLYIQKLSKTKGREVVPIDLAIARELISKELIVDKGRRLALTNLGSEVSCFL
jgi:hypothetical protein